MRAICHYIKNILLKTNRKSYQQFVVSKKTSIFAVPNSKKENNNKKYEEQ